MFNRDRVTRCLSSLSFSLSMCTFITCNRLIDLFYSQLTDSLVTRTEEEEEEKIEKERERERDMFIQNNALACLQVKNESLQIICLTLSLCGVGRMREMRGLCIHKFTLSHFLFPLFSVTLVHESLSFLFSLLLSSLVFVNSSCRTMRAAECEIIAKLNLTELG